MPSKMTFAEYLINPEVGTVSGPQGNIHIEPKNMDVLLVLLKANGEVVSREDILRQVWTHQEVSDDVINTAISKIRKALSEVGKSSQYLQTVPRKGYRLVYPHLTNVTDIYVTKSSELDTAEKNSDSHQSQPISHSNLKPQPLVNPEIRHESAPLSIIKNEEKLAVAAKSSSKNVLYILGFTLFITLLSLPFIYTSWQQRNLQSDILTLHKQQKLSYSSFLIQAKRRNELVDMITLRLSIKRMEQFEKFFAKYHPQMNKEELFVFDQIRGITKGTLYTTNSTMLNLMDNNPNIAREFPLADTLYKHLAFWMNKYQNVFISREDMCLLYVGVEDGVPYPSKLDKQVTQWLKEREVL